MGLSDVFKSGAAAAFKVAGDLRTEVTFLRNDLGTTYDATSGELDAGVREYHDVPVLIEDYGKEEIDGNLIQEGDQKLTVLQASLPFTPTNKDRVRIDSQLWHLIEIEGDMAGATWAIQMRGNV
jgi:hypothetical protein